LQIWATSSTQRSNRVCLGLFAAASTSIVVVAMMVNISRMMSRGLAAPDAQHGGGLVRSAL
jgi:hypothetical protein